MALALREAADPDPDPDPFSGGSWGAEVPWMLLLGTTESWSHVSLSPTSSHSLALGCPPVRSRQATDEAFTPGLVSSLCLSDPASPFWEEPRELVSTGSCNLTFNV